MRLAVISDIHGNMEALEQVLIDIDRSGVDSVCCLGDIIGYGPEPEQAISSIRGRGIPTVIGNHELAVVRPEHLTWFNPLARESLERTVEMLSAETISYIEDLPLFLRADPYRLVHGFPPDSPLVYITHVSEGDLSMAFEQTAETICFAGHTHGLEIIDYDGKHMGRSPLPKGVTGLSPATRYIVNVGSVGQPRDGNNNAKYVIWDADSHIVDVRYIPYDIKAVADKIIKSGLPVAHARKLW